jgi:hypothetical protein
VVDLVVADRRAEHGTLKIASIAAVVIAIAVCVYSTRGGRRPKMIELVAVATFIVFTVIAFVADPSVTHWLTSVNVTNGSDPNTSTASTPAATARAYRGDPDRAGALGQQAIDRRQARAGRPSRNLTRQR